jgi:hypothetical protein
MKKHLLFIFILIVIRVNGQTELISNGSFSNSSGWTTSGNWYISSSFSCYHSSGGYAFAGNSSGQAVINETGDLKQTITIPSTATSATFSFYVSKNTDEVATSTIYDYVDVLLLNGSGSQLMQFSSTNINNLYAGKPVTACDAYSTKSFSIPSAYFGQTLQIDFKVHTDGGPKNTMFRIDDVSLTYLSNSPCVYSLSSSSFSANSNSGTGNVSVITTQNCNWTAVSNSNWINVTSGSSGTGNGTANFSYTANGLSTTRTGTITIAGQTYTITQAGTTVSSLLLGVDISQNNGTVSWSNVYSAGKSYAYVKATEGTSCQSCATYFSTTINSSNPNGVILGAYHYARPDNGHTALEEANYFLSIAGNSVKSGFLPPALDMDAAPVISYLNNSHTTAQLAQWVNDWCTQIHNIKGIWPVLYVDRCRANQIVASYNGIINSNIKLWIADYPETAGNPQSYSGCGPNWNTWPWVFHQYFAPQNAGNNPSTNANPGMDQDAFNGDLTEFNNLINPTSPIVNLTIKSGSQSSSVSTIEAGSSLTVSAAESNIGNTPISNASNIGIWLSQSTNLNTNTATYLGKITGFSIIASNSSTTTLSQTINIPQNTLSGNYYLIFWADIGNCDVGSTCSNCSGDIIESDECDNFSSIPLNVTSSSSVSLTVTPTSWKFNKSADNKQLDLKSNSSWSASSNQAWLSLSKTSGSGDDNILITVTENVGLSQRNATVTFTAGNLVQTINVTQESTSSNNDQLSLNTYNINSNSEQSSSTIQLTSNTNWTITNPANWLTISPLNGTGNQILSLNIEANNGNTRSADLYFSAGSTNKILHIVQNGLSGINEPSNLNSINVYPNPSEGLFEIDFGKITGNKTITIYNLTGKQIFTSNTKNDFLELSLIEKSKGVYFLNIQTEQGNKNTKLILQ